MRVRTGGTHSTVAVTDVVALETLVTMHVCTTFGEMKMSRTAPAATLHAASRVARAGHPSSAKPFPPPLSHHWPRGQSPPLSHHWPRHQGAAARRRRPAQSDQ